MSRWVVSGRRGEVAGAVLAEAVLAEVGEVEGEEGDEAAAAAHPAHLAHLVGLREAHLQEVEVPEIQAQRGKLLRAFMWEDRSLTKSAALRHQ